VWGNIDTYANKMKKMLLWNKILKFILVLVFVIIVGGIINYNYI
jgi:hypothetical protein